MNAPSLEDALRNAGSAVKLLWKPYAPPPVVPRVPAQYSGWRLEQRAWEEGVALLDLCHHMSYMLVEGPDAVRLLSYVSANNFATFAVGQAKQLITVSPDGYLIQDAIVVRLAEQKFNVIGIGTAHNWIAFHAQKDGFDVSLTVDPPSDFRAGDPVMFRYQVQGPKAGGMLGRLFGSQLDDIKFFHFREVSLDGHNFYALRHGMAGQAGFEFFGPWALHDFVRDKLLAAGQADGIVRVGGLAYYTAGVDSGWLATPVAGIYTSGEMKGFRQFTSLFSYEGQMALQGSYYSPDIEDYYCSPFELGYGRSVSFNHDFVGRDALMAAKEKISRTKVTLVWNSEDVNRIFGDDHDSILSYTKDRVEVGDQLVGISQYATFMDPAGRVHSLAIIKNSHSKPGTEVTVRWGQHPGPDAGADYRENFETIRAVVQVAPINEVARTSYREG